MGFNSVLVTTQKLGGGYRRKVFEAVRGKASCPEALCLRAEASRLGFRGEKSPRGDGDGKMPDPVKGPVRGMERAWRDTGEGVRRRASG